MTTDEGGDLVGGLENLPVWIAAPSILSPLLLLIGFLARDNKRLRDEAATVAEARQAETDAADTREVELVQRIETERTLRYSAEDRAAGAEARVSGLTERVANLEREVARLVAVIEGSGGVGHA